MKSSNHFLLFLLLCTTFLLSVFIIFFKSKPPAPNPQFIKIEPTVSTVQTSQPKRINTILVPSGWETYTNSEDGYQFSYPPNWNYQTRKAAYNFETPALASTYPRYEKAINIYPLNKLTLAQIADRSYQYCTGKCPQMGDDEFETGPSDYVYHLPTIETRNTPNLSEYAVITPYSKLKIVLIPYPDKIQYLEFQPETWKNKEGKDILDQILSTFSFTTSSSPIPNPQDLLTYSSDFGYSFSYPPSFSVSVEDSPDVSVRSIKEHISYLNFHIKKCRIPLSNSSYKKTSERIGKLSLDKYTLVADNYFYVYSPSPSSKPICIHPNLSPERNQTIKNILSSFKPIPQKSLPFASSTNKQEYLNDQISIKVSVPINFWVNIESNGDMTITNGPISLTFWPDAQGSPCANAPCNKFKNVPLQIGNETISETLVWPDSFGYFTFKSVIPYPESLNKKGSLTIFGSFPYESDLKIVNQILSTFKFIN